jgi:hypothetical protein
MSEIGARFKNGELTPEQIYTELDRMQDRIDKLDLINQNYRLGAAWKESDRLELLARIDELEITKKAWKWAATQRLDEINRLNAVLDDCEIHIQQSEASSTLIGAVADVYYYERQRILTGIKQP